LRPQEVGELVATARRAFGARYPGGRAFLDAEWV